MCLFILFCHLKLPRQARRLLHIWRYWPGSKQGTWQLRANPTWITKSSPEICTGWSSKLSEPAEYLKSHKTKPNLERFGGARASAMSNSDIADAPKILRSKYFLPTCSVSTHSKIDAAPPMRLPALNYALVPSHIWPQPTYPPPPPMPSVVDTTPDRCSIK